MYGITTKISNASEAHFNEALGFFNEVAVAIEQLTNVEERGLNGRNIYQYKRDNDVVKFIITKFNSKLGLESFALETELVDDFVKVSGDLLKKLIAYIRNAVEYVTQTITTHKVTAKHLRDKASLLIGEADTNSKENSSNKVSGFIGNYTVFKELNINGKIPTNIEQYINRELQLSRKLAAVDYSEMINKLVSGMRGGSVSEEDRLDVLKKIRESCEKNLSVVTSNDTFRINKDDSCDYYQSEINPGNVALVVTVPKSIENFSKYSADIRPCKKNYTNTTNAKALDNKSIMESSRAIKIYCDEVIKNNKNQDSINKASREINFAFRKGDNRAVTELVKDFSKLIKNPHLTHTRMCLTLCARTLRYSKLSMNEYNKEAGVK